MFIFLFAPPPVQKKMGEKEDEIKPISILQFIESDSKYFNQRMQKLRELSAKDPSNSDLGNMVKIGTAFENHFDRIKEIFAELPEKSSFKNASVTTGTALITIIGAPLYSIYTIYIKAGLGQTSREVTARDIVKAFKETGRDIAGSFWSGKQITKEQSERVASFLNAVIDWSKDLLKVYNLHKELSEAILENNESKMSYLGEKLFTAFEQLNKTFRRVELGYKIQGKVQESFDDTYDLIKEFMKTSGMLAGTLFLPTKYELLNNLGKLKKVLPVRTPVNLLKLGELGAVVVGGYILPAFRARGILLSSAFVLFTQSDNAQEFDHIYQLWKSQKEVIRANELGGEDEIYEVKGDKSGYYIEMKRTDQKVYLEKIDGNYYYEKKKARPIELNDIIKALTKGVIEESKDFVEINFVLGGVAKTVKVMWGSARYARIATVLGLDQKIFELLAKYGFDPKKRETMEIVAKIIAKPEDVKEILDAYKIFEKVSAKKLAAEIGKVAEQEIEEASKLLYEESARKVGKYTRKLFRMAEIITGASFLI